jgi:hypothetical protein
MRVLVRSGLIAGAAVTLTACADGYDPFFGGPTGGPYGDPGYRGYGYGDTRPYPYGGGAYGAPPRGETVTVLGCPERRGAGFVTLRASDGRTWTLDNPRQLPDSGYTVEATGRVLGAGAEGTVAALGDVQWRYTGVRCPSDY